MTGGQTEKGGLVGKLMVVVGGQFGSEGKGAVTAALAAREEEELAVVRVGGPNAGHTVWDCKGVEWKLRHIPVAAVVNERADLYIGPGSEVDCTVLSHELKALDEAGYDVFDRLGVDKSATLLTPDHQDAEILAGLDKRIGSTVKGIGAARVARIKREADTLGGSCDVAGALRRTLDRDGIVLVEATQGWGLGLHTEFYPRTTSSDCDAQTMLSMAGVCGWGPSVDELEVWVVYRTLPIRVAGNSGPLKNETTWAELGIAEEKTTVTKKVRRVGLWDRDLAQKALVANGGPGGPVRIAMTGLDLLFPDLMEERGRWGRVEELRRNEEAWTWLQEREEELGQEVSAVGIGPRLEDLLWRD